MSECIKTRRGGTGGRWRNLFRGTPQFEYTGEYELVQDTPDNFRIKFLTSGIFTLYQPSEMVIDVFLVGGGGGGQTCGSGGSYVGAGGGGGYTHTFSTIIRAGASYPVVIGSGGSGGYQYKSGQYYTGNCFGYDGGATSAFGMSMDGGTTSYANNKSTNGNEGGDGGSGGANREVAKSMGRDGGSDGSNGWGADQYGNGGKGQGITTREFGEPDGTLYSGGGGSAGDEGGGNGGAGGGGNGALNYTDAHATFYGGGGGGVYNTTTRRGGNGYQGICIIRNKRSV